MTHRLSLKPIFALAACFTIALALVGCSSGNSTQEENASENTSNENVTLEIYAANSLEKALDEVQKLYTSQNPSVTFADTQYEASGTLVEKMKA